MGAHIAYFYIPLPCCLLQCSAAPAKQKYMGEGQEKKENTAHYMGEEMNKPTKPTKQMNTGQMADVELVYAYAE